MGAATDLALALDRPVFVRALGLELDPWQTKLLRSAAPRVLLNCSRQSGKSTMAALMALHHALYLPSSLVLVLAPALRQSQELFTKIAGFYASLESPVAPLAQRRLSLELENASRIVTLPGTERTIRGFSGASLLIVDEAARVADELYFAVRPMLAVSGGSLMMLSTPYGKRGVFFEMGRYVILPYDVHVSSNLVVQVETSILPKGWEISIWPSEGSHWELKDLLRELGILGEFEEVDAEGNSLHRSSFVHKYDENLDGIRALLQGLVDTLATAAKLTCRQGSEQQRKMS